MQDPYKRPAPTKDQPVLRVQEYARDLAYGALHGWWNAELPQSTSKGDALWDLHNAKWKGEVPNWDLLVSFGYLVEPGGPGHRWYILTPKAYESLETVASKTSVFISYGRKMSSAFALAIQYKLLSLGVIAFLDRDIELGDEWHARLEQKIKECDYFISILAQGVLESETLRKEITWACEANRLCIPIWHAGFSYEKEVDPRVDLSKAVKEYISRKNAYIITGDDSAMKYHDAVESVINRLQ